MTEKNITWSYSGLTKFENCPRQYQKTYVTKEVQDEETEQTRWGTEVHLALEERVRDDKPLPANMTQYEPMAARFAAAKAHSHVYVEYEMAVDKSLNPVAFDSPSRWVRGIADIVVLKVGKDGHMRGFAGDYKTGKKRDGSRQLALMAAMLFKHFPELVEIRTGFIWLANGGITEETFYRVHAGKIWGEFMPRVARLEKAFELDRWVPNPSGLCGWCPCTLKECDFAKPKRRK